MTELKKAEITYPTKKQGFVSKYFLCCIPLKYKQTKISETNKTS